MINLIPASNKASIYYARRNSFILGWLSLILFAVIGLVIILGGSMFYIRQEIKSNEQSIKTAQESLASQNEKETLERVAEISGRLSLAADVISKEVLFSKLLPYIGALMPDGTVLQGLSLSRDTQGGLDLTISATDYITASQALVNLQASDSLLFEGADANNITCDGSTDPVYKCVASFRATLVKDNPFLLLNQGAKDE